MTGKRSSRLGTCVLVLASLAWGQQDRGASTGTVTDPTASVTLNVAVTVQKVETNVTCESRTNEAGQFMVPNLPVGRYRITLEAPGSNATSETALH